MKITRTFVYRYELPLRAPVVTARGALRTRAGWLLCLETDNGLKGWGEAAPLTGFSPETQEEAARGLIECADKLRDCGLVDAFAMRRTSAFCPSVSFALETAVLRLAAGVLQVPMRRIMAEQSAETVRVCALLPDGDPRVARNAKARLGQVPAAAKLKVGRGSPADDIAAVRQVREALGPDVAIRVDVNRAWDLPTALNFAGETASCNLAYLEEPLRDWRDLPAFASACPVPYALDETLQENKDYLATLLLSGGKGANAYLDHVLRGARAWVVKPSLMHFHGLVEWLREVEPPPYVVVSGAYESGVGMSALAQYAAAISGPGIAAGLDTYHVLGRDVLRESLDFGGEIQMVALDRPLDLDPGCLECVWDG
ncbi:MAG: o-succinylbenzoate synthase [Candidatus Hydrogenedentes bacterium]|nr:o-succinylbenzoate synthase [Candidatus Hydrogenedentota bacterium]